MSAFSGVHALIVDDNAHMRTIVAVILRGLGMQDIKEASDGADELGVMRDWNPDLVFCDLAMSPIDGLEFARMVRTAPDRSNPHVPIIMMTGHTERSKILAARDAGVNELLAKPISAKAMVERMQAVFERPKLFVRSLYYTGPCRRRGRTKEYLGPWRRKGETDGPPKPSG